MADQYPAPAYPLPDPGTDTSKVLGTNGNHTFVMVTASGGSSSTAGPGINITNSVVSLGTTIGKRFGSWVIADMVMGSHAPQQTGLQIGNFIGTFSSYGTPSYQNGILTTPTTTAASIGSYAGIGYNLFLCTLTGLPVWSHRFNIGTTTNVQAWTGLFVTNSAGTDASSTSNTLAFRYDTSLGDTNWQAVSVNNSGTATVIDTGIVPTSTITQELKIDASNNASILFSINGVVKATITTHIPSITTGISPLAYVTTLANTAITTSWGPAYIECF